MKNTLLLIVSVLFTVNLSWSQGWEDLESGTGYILFDLSIPPGQSDVIYAAGMQYTYDAEGIIIKSIDGGDTWTQIVGGPNTPGFEAICFTSTEVGYVAGWDGYFAKTTDGGTTWNPMTSGGDDWFFMDLEFFDADHGVALVNLNSGLSGVYYTTNAGATWSSAFGINHNIQDLAYADANTVFAVGGDEKMSKSTNGGSSWTEIYSGTFQRFFIGCDFNGDFGVVGGEDGKILSTTDGGTTWNTFATGYHNFQGVHVFDTDSAYIGGTDEDVYKTTDWGANWVVEDNGSGQSHIYKVKFADDGTGFLCGSQGLLKRKEVAALPLMAMFEASETDICADVQIEFTDMSSGNIESREWTFEGGEPETSTEQNPIVTYATPGVYNVTLTVSNTDEENTLVMEDYITVHNCAGINDENETEITIYPNPAADFTSLKGIEEGAEIRILDLKGKLILKTISYERIDLSMIPNGIYILETTSYQNIIQKKLLIQK